MARCSWPLSTCLTFSKVRCQRGSPEGPEEVEAHDGHPAEHGEAGQVEKEAQNLATQWAYSDPVGLLKEY